MHAAPLPGGAEHPRGSAALRPSWASEITSFTPCEPALDQARAGSRSRRSPPRDGPMCRPTISRRPSVLTATAIMAATETIAAALAHLEVGRVEPEIGPLAGERALEEGVHPLVDVLAQLGDRALGDAGHAHGLHQIVDPAGARRRRSRPPGSPRPAPSRPSSAAPGSRESSCRCRSLGILQVRCRGASRGCGRDSRCARSAARRCARSGRRRSRPRHRLPSGSAARSRRQCAGSRRRPAFASSSASGSLSSVIGVSFGSGEVRKLHHSRSSR